MSYLLITPYVTKDKECHVLSYIYIYIVQASNEITQSHLSMFSLFRKSFLVSMEDDLHVLGSRRRNGEKTICLPHLRLVDLINTVTKIIFFIF